MAKSKRKITYEMLRKDAAWIADFIAIVADEAVEGRVSAYDLTVLDHGALRSFAAMLKGSTHIVIQDADQLPED